MNLRNQVQILDETVCISLCADALEKGMKPHFSPQLWINSKATNLGEEKTQNSEPESMGLVILPHKNPLTVKPLHSTTKKLGILMFHDSGLSSS